MANANVSRILHLFFKIMIHSNIVIWTWIYKTPGMEDYKAPSQYKDSFSMYGIFVQRWDGYGTILTL